MDTAVKLFPRQMTIDLDVTPYHMTTTSLF